MDTKDILKNVKNSLLIYNKTLLAEKIIKILLERYGYQAELNKHDELKNECLKYIKMAKKKHISIPNSYYMPDINLSALEIKKIFVMFMIGEFNKIDGINKLYPMKDKYEEYKDKITDIFIEVYHNLNAYDDSEQKELLRSGDHALSKSKRK